MWSNLIEHTQPKAICPFNMTSVKITNAILDLGLVSHLPLDGYTWITSFKLYKPIGIGHKKDMLLCIISEATITQTRRENGKK